MIFLLDIYFTSYFYIFFIYINVIYILAYVCETNLNPLEKKTIHSFPLAIDYEVNGLREKTNPFHSIRHALILSSVLIYIYRRSNKSMFQKTGKKQDKVVEMIKVGNY